MPNADENIISSLENKLATMKSFTTLLEEGNTIENILDMLLGEFGVNILDKIPVEFYCNCSKEKVEKALISIGKEELQNIIEEDKNATLHCHFCNKDYEFNEQDLVNLLNVCTK